MAVRDGGFLAAVVDHRHAVRMFRDRVLDSGRDCGAAVCVSCDARKVRFLHRAIRGPRTSPERPNASPFRALDTRGHGRRNTGNGTARSQGRDGPDIMPKMERAAQALRSRHDPWQGRILAGAAYPRNARSLWLDGAMLAAYTQVRGAMMRTLRAAAHTSRDCRLRREDRGDDRQQVPVMRLAGAASRKSWSPGRSSSCDLVSTMMASSGRSIVLRSTIERAFDRRSVGAHATVRWPLRAKTARRWRTAMSIEFPRFTACAIVEMAEGSRVRPGNNCGR